MNILSEHLFDLSIRRLRADLKKFKEEEVDVDESEEEEEEEDDDEANSAGNSGIHKMVP
jgi:hypothetical protein